MCNVLVGGCIGDALGVPFETFKPNHPLLVNWDNKTFLGNKHHKLEPGQFSDDGQMMIMIAESLIDNCGFNPDDLSQRYINWITSGKFRGCGRTTLNAIQKLQSGIHWSKSGIEGSIGNGTAMRAAPFGVYFRNDLTSLISSVKIDSAITHVSAESEAGALCIALTVYFILNGHDGNSLLKLVSEYLPETQIKSSLETSLPALLSSSISSKNALLALGTKADVRQTVPAALYTFLKFDNYKSAIVAAIRAGGDTDTTGAIVGALCGARFSIGGINNIFYSVEDFDKLLKLDSQLYNKSDKLCSD